MPKIYTIRNKVLINTANNKWLSKALPPIPPNTVRVRTKDRQAPVKQGSLTTYEIATLVEGTTDVYDVYKSGTNFYDLLYGSNNVIEVLGADTNGVTDMQSMFEECNSLVSVTSFDTSNVTTMSKMFYYCSSLTSIPLFDTSKVQSMSYMFNNCVKVQSGALAFYQHASTHSPDLYSHLATFRNCGSYTQTGSAELAQIPDDWK